MKTSFLLAAIAPCLALAGTAAGQDYSIDWYTVDGGGGTSAGRNFSVSGTSGQPDASLRPMTGGSLSLVGGYWSLFSVEPPGGLLLTIRAVGPGLATLSWVPDTPGYVLQETLTLSPSDWRPAPSGSMNPVVVPLVEEMKFYRLFRP